MNKYLEKIAKEYLNTEQVEDPSISRKLGLAAVGGMSAGLGMKYIGNPLGQRIGKALINREPTYDEKFVEELKERYGRETGTKFSPYEIGGSGPNADRLRNMLDIPGNPHYADKEMMNKALKRMDTLQNLQNGVLKKIGLGRYAGGRAESTPFTHNLINEGYIKNIDATIHELGHAVDFKDFKAARPLSRVSRLLSTPLAGGAIGGAMLSNEKTRDYAWTAPILSNALTWREEAAANRNAYKMIKAHGRSGKGFLPTIALNALSYATPAFITGGVLAGVNHLRHKGEEVNPDEWLSDRE